MEHYIGLDVSLKQTHLCAVDASGAVIGRACETTQPDLLARAIGALCPSAKLAVLETGGQSSWLHRELGSRGGFRWRSSMRAVPRRRCRAG